MRVKSLMTSQVTSCAPETSLAEAARTMRSIDAGILPVISGGKTIGVVTDRDIAVALGEADRRPSEMKVSEAMSRTLYSCSPDTDVRRALAPMKEKRVRRLPVLDEGGQLVGIVSINDVILHSEAAGDGWAVSYDEIVNTLQHICAHRYPIPPAKPADVTELARSF